MLRNGGRTHAPRGNRPVKPAACAGAIGDETRRHERRSHASAKARGRGARALGASYASGAAVKAAPRGSRGTRLGKNRTGDLRPFPKAGARASFPTATRDDAASAEAATR